MQEYSMIILQYITAQLIRYRMVQTASTLRCIVTVVDTHTAQYKTA